MKDILQCSKLSCNYIEKEELKPKPLVEGDHDLLLLLPPATQCAACGLHLSGPAQAQLQFPAVPWFSDEFGLFFVRFPNHPIIHDSVGEPWIVTCAGRDCATAGLGIQWERYSTEKATLIQFLSSSELCNGCLRYSVKTHKCSRCLSVRYCSNDCLARDWRNHREPCRILRLTQTSVLGKKDRNKSEDTCEALLLQMDPYLPSDRPNS